MAHDLYIIHVFLDMFRTLFLREQVGLAFEGSLELMLIYINT